MKEFVVRVAFFGLATQGLENFDQRLDFLFYSADVEKYNTVKIVREIENAALLEVETSKTYEI